MKKYLFYMMEGQKMCALHGLMNAVDLMEDHEVAVIFEGAACKLPPEFEKEQNPMYLKLKEAGKIAGVCLACSKMLEVYDAVKETGLDFLDDMMGHAGTKPFIEQGYEVMVF